MDPTSREDLSALMDGELGAEPARFLLRRMENEPGLARAWSRWHLIRACLGGARDAAQDPVRLAGANDEDAFAARVLQAVQAQPQRARHRWARYLGGGAIAASVAAAALILSVPQTTSTETSLAAAPERTATAAARTGMIAAAPVSAKRESTQLPWLNNRQPTFLAATPAMGGGLLQSNYLQQAAYAPDAGTSVLTNEPGTAGTPPYMILLVPGRGTAQAQQH
ncbi:MAG TPA: sigma-E factor negative regulatory protein [Rhodanobacteraceae bacterium]|nr:sigma-E factor negative regulatory protein [Rhodanobacteraceae bacterium]